MITNRAVTTHTAGLPGLSVHPHGNPPFRDPGAWTYPSGSWAAAARPAALGRGLCGWEVAGAHADPAPRGCSAKARSLYLGQEAARIKAEPRGLCCFPQFPPRPHGPCGPLGDGREAASFPRPKEGQRLWAGHAVGTSIQGFGQGTGLGTGLGEKTVRGSPAKPPVGRCPEPPRT